MLKPIFQKCQNNNLLKMFRRTNVPFWIISAFGIFGIFSFISVNFHSTENDVTNSKRIGNLVQQYEASILGDTNPLSTVLQAEEKQPKIWVSMGLCFSENTEKYGKKSYPYAEVTPLSIQLWSYFFPDESKALTSHNLGCHLKLKYFYSVQF